MRFHHYDPNFALVRFADGKPIKVDAKEAAHLPGGAFEFNEQLFQLLAAAFENKDTAALDSLWAAAHKQAPPLESRGLAIPAPPLMPPESGK